MKPSNKQLQKKPAKTAAPKTAAADESKHLKFLAEDGVPFVSDTRHHMEDASMFEVSPEQLIDVAKHFAFKKYEHKEAVAVAYDLICEAHLVSRNIRKWNEKVKTCLFSPEIHQVVVNAAKNNQGQPLREAVLVDFFSSIARGSNSTNASKKFNEWINEDLRRCKFEGIFPWNPVSSGTSPEQNKTYQKNGWIKWACHARGNHLIVPERTEPKTKLPHEPKKEEHPTEAYWLTKDVWWPEPESSEIEVAKSRWLTSNRKAFHSVYNACEALTAFKAWLELQAALMPAKKQIRNRSKSGNFVSAKDKGANRAETGKYVKNR
jgi:hypothetical protein